MKWLDMLIANALNQIMLEWMPVDDPFASGDVHLPPSSWGHDL